MSSRRAATTPQGGAQGGLAGRNGGHGGAAQGSLVLTKAMFTSLRNKDFFFVWSSNLAAMFGMQMQMVARGWLIYDMTTSALALAWVTLSFMAPTLAFSLIGGVIADRLRKKWVMLIGQALHFLAILVLATVTIQGDVTFTHFIFWGLFNGTVMALNSPARQAIIPSLVGQGELVNAVALSTASMNLSRILAPTMAGVLIAVVAGGDKTSFLGVGIVFYLIAFLDFVSIVLLLGLKDEGRDTRRERRSMGRDLADGLRYVRKTPVIGGLLVLGFVPLIFGMPVQFLLPVVNKDVLHMGPDGLGLLMTAMGAGALVGSLVLAGMGDMRHKGLILLASSAAWAVFLGMFAVSENLPLALVSLALVGLASTAYMAMNMALVQLAVADEMRGRVMSLAMMTFGLMPLGVFPMSIVAERVGIGAALLLGAAGLAIASLVAAVAFPSIRRIDKGHAPATAGDAAATQPGVAPSPDVMAKT